jgi:hypothetical protein
MVTAAVEASDVVIIWGCGDTCPILGNATKTGSSTTPAGKGIEVVRPIRDEIRRRVEQLITELQPQRPATRHYIGDGAAAGWTTLGAGRRVSVGGLDHAGSGSPSERRRIV